jgi:hypothetical protein
MGAWERLNTFVVSHGPCGVAVEFATDPMVEGDEVVGVWTSARCGGCGTSIRERAPWSEVAEQFTEFCRLTAAADVDVRDVLAALQLGDEAKLAELQERVAQSPAMLRVALEGIRRGQADRTQN